MNKVLVVVMLVMIGCSSPMEEDSTLVLGEAEYIDTVEPFTYGYDVGNVLPEMTLLDTEGWQVNMYDYQNLDVDYLIIDYSYLLCGPCKTLGQYHNQIVNVLNRETGNTYHWLTVLDGIVPTETYDAAAWAAETQSEVLLDKQCIYCQENIGYPTILLIDLDSWVILYKRSGFLDPKKIPSNMQSLIEGLSSSSNGSSSDYRLRMPEYDSGLRPSNMKKD